MIGRPDRCGGYITAALLSVLATVVVAGLLTTARLRDGDLERRSATREALAQAKRALLAYAASGPHPPGVLLGSLPCPDLRNDGYAPGVCAEAVRRLGRLPWRTLGLPDLRDADGERLWYAVSGRFVETLAQSPCPLPGSAACLNSDTPGAITVRESQAAGLATGSNAAIAVVLSPGAALTRQGAASPQDRGCRRGLAADAQCLGSGICSGANLLVAGRPDYQQTARCDPANYLDVVGPPVLNVAGNPGAQEDNVGFQDFSATDGLLLGPVLDANRVPVLNDTGLLVERGDLFPPLERRVGADVLRCLVRYGAANGGHYPWTAAPDSYDPTVGPTPMVPGNSFGRVPDESTLAGLAAQGMSSTWPGGCPLAGSPVWWTHWRELVFFATAPAFAPGGPAVDCSAGCFRVGWPTAPASSRLVVLVAGGALPGTPTPQLHRSNATPTNYLEGSDLSGAPYFITARASSTFNDVVLAH